MRGKRGWFDMHDVLGLTSSAALGRVTQAEGLQDEVEARREGQEEIMRTPFTGVGTALVTPFTKSGELDEKAVRRLGRRQIDNGIHFLVPDRNDRRESHARR